MKGLTPKRDIDGPEGPDPFLAGEGPGQTIELRQEPKDRTAVRKRRVTLLLQLIGASLVTVKHSRLLSVCDTAL